MLLQFIKNIGLGIENHKKQFAEEKIVLIRFWAILFLNQPTSKLFVWAGEY
jgi:hypothetical protein